LGGSLGAAEDDVLWLGLWGFGCLVGNEDPMVSEPRDEPDDSDERERTLTLSSDDPAQDRHDVLVLASAAEAPCD